MLSKRILNNFKQLRAATSMIKTVRMFSAEGASQPSQQEIDANRAEWGIKYNDECLKFEKEWQILAEQVEREQKVYIESELGDLQREKVNLLVDKVVSLNVYEIRYFEMMLADKVQKTTGINPMKLNLDWPSIKKDSTGTWPPANPNWFK